MKGAVCRVWFSAVSLKFPTKFDIISERDMLPFDPQDDFVFKHLEEARCLRKLLVGAAECKGAPIHYYLLVETLENGVETYGVLVEYLTQRTEVPGITVFPPPGRGIAGAFAAGKGHAGDSPGRDGGLAADLRLDLL